MSGHDTKLSIDTTSIVYNEIILNLLNLAAPFSQFSRMTEVRLQCKSKKSSSLGPFGVGVLRWFGSRWLQSSIRLQQKTVNRGDAKTQHSTAQVN